MINLTKRQAEFLFVFFVVFLQPMVEHEEHNPHSHYESILDRIIPYDFSNASGSFYFDR